jgi:hypothetical protein
MTEKADKNFGKLPFHRLTELFLPTWKQVTTNGVMYPEMMMYTGIAVLFIWNVSWWWLALIFAILTACGLISPIQRIPSRSFYLLTLSLATLIAQGGSHSYAEPVSIFLMQAYLLIHTASIYPQFPFTQWWDRPSKLYNKKPKSYNWPFNTGYLVDKRISEYRGAFRLA